jgi:hypothetical protein
VIFVRACCLLILAVAAVSQQTAPAAQSTTRPVSATVVVHPAAGASAYRVGEEIPLELEFLGTADQDYYFETGSCSLLGQVLSDETVAATPSDGIDDPRAASPCGGSGYSCLGGRHPLDGTPLVVRVPLNDAVRFTRPGTYHVVVSSTRLKRQSSQAAPILTAAPVDLTIVPLDEPSGTAEVKRASALVDQGTEADIKRGTALLRYLGTEDAATALVARYEAIARAGGDIDGALVSAARRAFVIAQMEARVEEGANLNTTFFATLSRLRVLVDLPAAPGDCDVRSTREKLVQTEYDARWRAALAQRPATDATLRSELAETEYDARWRAALERRPVTAATLGAEMERLLAWNVSAELQQHIVQDLEQHPIEAAGGFAALPPDTQGLLLESATTWRYLNRPWMLLALRQTYGAWRASPRQGGFPGVGDSALKRLYELAPDEGRRLILTEMRTGDHGIRYDALAVLPDAQLAELDTELQARYAHATDPATRLQDRDTTAWLIARYGSPGLLPFVVGMVRPDSCVSEGAVLAYLFKHDPAVALSRLQPNLDLATQRDRVCISPLGAVVAHYWDDRVESAAIGELTDASIRRQADAAAVLGGHGSIAAKQPLLDRLARWSTEWQGRGAHVAAAGQWPLATGLPAPETLGNTIVRALFENPRFVLTTSEVAHIRTLCVTDDCRATVDRLAHGIK